MMQKHTVITVTLNPALDKTLYIDGFAIDSVNRVTKSRTDIGGKGINVSKVLKNLNIHSECVGFLGENIKECFLKELQLKAINTGFTSINDDTRINIKIVDEMSKINTDVNERGPQITETELKDFMEKFEGVCGNGDIVVLSGGVSPSIPKDIYRKLIEIAKAKKAITILDADGELLKEGLKAKPHIIKPNEHELGTLLNIDIDNRDKLIKAGEKFIQEGISKVMISLGAKGAIYITENGTYSTEGLKVSVKSTVGAGDSMVAAMVYSIINNYDDIETLRFATACGAATVMLEGTQPCTTMQVENLLTKVEVIKG